MLYMDELIQHVVQDIAMDGSLGATPEYLHDLIDRTVPTLPSSSTSKPLIDDAFLAYFWRLLIAVPCIEVIILDSFPETAAAQPGLIKQPAPALTGRTRPKAPRKPTGRKRKNPTEEHLAADKEYEVAKAAFLAQLEASSAYVEPLRVIDQDDGSPDKISKLDLPGLQNRYGHRLRIRVDADERYHALTGVFNHIPCVTVLALRCLQVIGRSRSAGVTGHELTSLLGVDPKAMHHYTKVLMQLKLIDKVPVQQNSQRTNRHLLVRYTHQNEDFRACYPEKFASQPTLPAPGDDDFDINSDDEETLHKFRYPPMSLAQLQTGILLKQRLVEILDSGLQSNCLRNIGVLRLVGFVDDVGQSEQRLYRRHVTALVNSGIVERLDVFVKNGDHTSKVQCLRLMKYNPARQNNSASVSLPIPQEDPDEEDDEIEEIHRPPFNAMIAVSATRTIEYSVIDVITQAPENLSAPGYTLTGLGQAVGRLAPRTIEFFVNKIEQSESVPHLSDKAIAIMTETEGRQRNLRVVNILAYYRYCEAQRLPIDTERFAPPTPEAGSFGDLSHRSFYSKQSEYVNHISRRDLMDGGNAVATVKAKGRPKKPRAAEGASAGKKKSGKPLNPHGRPRKYVYFVNEKNKRWRSTIVGDIKMRKGYPACVIYIKSLKKVVIAPDGWTGIGQMPTLTPEVLATARTIQEFLKDPRGDGTGVIRTDDEGRQVEAEAQDEEEDELDHTPPKKKAKLEIGARSRSESSSREAHLSEVPPESMQVDPVMEVPSSPPAEPSPPPLELTKAKPRGRKRKEIQAPSLEPEVPMKRSQRGKRAVQPTPPVELEPPPAASAIASKSPSPIAIPTAPKTVTAQTNSPTPPAPEITPLDQLPSVGSDTVATHGEASQEQSLSASMILNGTVEPSASSTDPVTTVGDPPRRSFNGAPRISVTDTVKKNEVLQCLRDSGGIALKHDLRNWHTEWAARTAGTPKLYYPRTAVTFDRRTYYRILDNALMNGETVEEQVKVSTATGTSIESDIVFLAGTSKQAVEDFKSRLGPGANSRSVVIIRGPRAKATTVEQGQFSTVKAAKSTPSHKKTPAERLKEKELGLSEGDSATRKLILKERYTVAQLYGFKVGRAARARILHEEIARIVCEGGPGVIDSDEGVFTFACLFQEMTLGGFTSVMPISTYREHFLEFLKTPANREIRLKDLDASVHPQRTSYDQKRMLIVLSILHELGLISALEGCEAEEASVVVTRTDASSLHFKLAAEPYQDLQQGSIHYRLHPRAPVYDLRAPNPLLVGVFPAKTPEDSKNLWSVITRACRGVGEMEQLDKPSADFFPNIWPGREDTVKTLVNERSWFDTFKINETQRSVLNDAIDWATATRKVSTMQEILALCYKAIIPPQIAADYLVKMEFAAKSRLRRHAESDAPLRRMIRAKASAEGKLGARNAERAQQWERTFSHVAERYDLQWDDELKESLKQHYNGYLSRADKRLPVAEVEKVLLEKISGVPTKKGAKGKTSEGRPPPMGAQSSTVVDDMPANATLPPLQPSEIVDLRKPLPKGPDEPSKNTRHRHSWPEEDVDLLLDAEAIIRSRGRNITGGSRGHAALDQIFVGWRIPSLHNVLNRIRTTDPAKGAYYTRLEEAWHNIYMSNRGTPSLPDPNPKSPQKFDLLYHINFLRKHVNKAALRVDAPVGVEYIQGAAPREIIHLPLDIDHLLGQYTVQLPAVHDNAQEYWRGNSDEQKLGLLVKASFTAFQSRPPNVGDGDPYGNVIDSLLKMIIGTSEADYEENAVNRILEPYDRKICEEATKSLVDRGIFSRAAGQQRSKHQHYGYNVTWLNASAGPYPESVHLEAENLDDGLAEQKEQLTWPIVGKEGELAALMTLASEGVVDMQIDTRSCSVLKREIDDHATRTMTDAETEATITVISTGRPLSPLVTEAPLEIDVEGSSVVALVDLARSAGVQGLTRKAIEIALPSISASELSEISQAPGLNWVGYDTARLVHSDHMHKWLVAVYPWESPESIAVPPRKWFNIWGDIVEADWQRSVRLAVGHILSRPGISEQNLRLTLSTYLDRLETNAVLAHLVSNRIARRCAIEPKHAPHVHPVEQTDVSEEEFICWTMNPDTLWRRGQEFDE